MAAGHRTRKSAEAASLECSEERMSDGSFHKHLAGLMRGAYRMKRSGNHFGGDSNLKQVRKIDSFISPAMRNFTRRSGLAGYSGFLFWTYPLDF
jgi:hypothetical protein